LVLDSLEKSGRVRVNIYIFSEKSELNQLHTYMQMYRKQGLSPRFLKRKRKRKEFINNNYSAHNKKENSS
jgi:hypothetical protein